MAKLFCYNNKNLNQCGVLTLISYKPFQKLLIDREIKKRDLIKMAGISWTTMAKLNTTEYVSLEIIDKICSALRCQPGDLLEHVPDEVQGKE